MRADRDRGLFVCGYCGAEAVPPIEDDGVLELGPAKEKCPACATLLVRGALETFDVLYCPRCRGMLLTMDDFQPLVAALRLHREGPAAFIAPRSRVDANRALPCPKCSAAMDNHPYGGGGNVNVDTCETCGV